MAHFQLTSDGWIVGTGSTIGLESESLPSFAAVLGPKGKLRSFAPPAEIAGRYVGESLSLVLQEAKKLVYMTLPWAKSLIIWNYETQQLVRCIPLNAHPKGVALTPDHRYVVVSENFRADTDKGLILIRTNDFSVARKIKGHGIGGTGSHITEIKDFS